MTNSKDSFKEYFTNKGLSDVALDDMYDDFNCADYEVRDYDVYI